MLASTSLLAPTGRDRIAPKNSATPKSPGLVDRLLNASIVLAEDWQALPRLSQDELARCQDSETVLLGLVHHNLLTEYQADRIRAGTTYGLVLGNFRVLDRLGAGATSVVFKAEHIEMRRIVAIKVLAFTASAQLTLLSRFVAEMRTIAQLQHPNIVAAFDAGKTTPPDPALPVLRYIVMEFVPGKTLEALVEEHGRLDAVQACDIIHQIASALAEANKHGLVHRDIKPSNIIITPEGQAKLLDFGLVRKLGNNLTEAGTILGTIAFMAPEQSEDASRVDIRADLYGLGGTLYWCLTGKAPFSCEGRPHENLVRRLTQAPPAVRAVRPEISVELEAVVTRLMAMNPADRYAKPQDLMRALLPFLRPESRDDLFAASERGGSQPDLEFGQRESSAAKVHRVLIVDDQESMRSFCKLVLQAEGIQCDEACDGESALQATRGKAYDLVITDNHMPRMKGVEVLNRLSATGVPTSKLTQLWRLDADFGGINAHGRS